MHCVTHPMASTCPGGGSGHPARAGKLTGMLLELDVHEIIPLLVFPDMVR